MGTFGVKLGIDTNYNDPDYRIIFVKVTGQAVVSFEGHDGSEQDQSYITSIIATVMNDVLYGLAQEKVSYKDITAHKDRFVDGISSQFEGRGITLDSLDLSGIVPDEKTRARMEQEDKYKALARMSPEELAKMQQEKLKEAQRRWDALTPEEKARIEAENRRRAEEAAESIRQAQELAKQVSGKDANFAAAGVAAAQAGAVRAAAGAPLPPSSPKFCPNCGSPVSGGKFCGDCGSPL